MIFNIFFVAYASGKIWIFIRPYPIISYFRGMVAMYKQSGRISFSEYDIKTKR